MELLVQRLLDAGFTPQESKTLANLEVHKPFTSKSSDEIRNWVSQNARLYACPEKDIRTAILTHPQFAGLNHSRVVKDALEVYGSENEKAVKKAVLSFPQFAGYDHSRVVKDALEVYGSENEKAVKKAVLTHPPFAGLNHSRVIRQKTRVGKIFGLSKTDAISELLKKPVLAGYSYRRDLAAVRIAKKALKDFTQEKLKTVKSFKPEDKHVQALFKAYLSHASKSPYAVLSGGVEGKSGLKKAETQASLARKKSLSVTIEEPKMLAYFRKALKAA